MKPIYTAIVSSLFRTHSASTTTVADAFFSGDVARARRALNYLVKWGCVARAQNEWDGSRYEDRRRTGGSYSATIWQITIEPGQVTDAQVETLLGRTKGGECFGDVAIEMEMGC